MDTPDERHRALVESFFGAFAGTLPESSFHITPMLVIPAANASLGDLRVVFDNGEITVSIGQSFHEHFRSGAHAAEFVRDVLSEQIWIRLYFDQRGALLSDVCWSISESDEPATAHAYKNANWVDHTWKRRVREGPSAS